MIEKLFYVSSRLPSATLVILRRTFDRRWLIVAFMKGPLNCLHRTLSFIVVSLLECEMHQDLGRVNKQDILGIKSLIKRSL